MTSTQKHAWFNLAVVLASVVTVAALVPVLGPRRAQGGFGLLAFQAFGYYFYRRRPGSVAIDERDALLKGRSLMIAYAVFWVAFVAACVGAPAVYGSHGAVPVELIQASVWAAWCLVSFVDAVATLVQYGRGGADAS